MPGPLPAYGPGSMHALSLNVSKCGAFVFHPPPILRIRQIDRLHNPLLLQRYLHEREAMLLFKGNRGCASIDDVIGNPMLRVHPDHSGMVCLNEFFLFHGCKADRAELIAVSGFDFRRGGENRGKLFGAGTYFSPLASKADLYTRPVGDDPAAAPAVAKPARLSSTSATIRASSSTQLQTSVVSGDGAGSAGSSSSSKNNFTCVFKRPACMSAPQGSGSRTPATPREDRGANKSRARALFGFASYGLRKGHGGGRGENEMDPRLSESCVPLTASDSATRGECVECTRSFASVARTPCARFDSCGGLPLKSGKTSSPEESQNGEGEKEVEEEDHNTRYAQRQHIATNAMNQSGQDAEATMANPKTAIRTLILSRVCLGEVYRANRAMPEARMPPAVADPCWDAFRGAGDRGSRSPVAGSGSSGGAASGTARASGKDDSNAPVCNPTSPESQLIHYDSVMAENRTKGGVVDSIEFVVFERGQALPLYCITYTHDPSCCCASCYRYA
ncbi:conserved hypothetical protein [Neospora caninum Liverpool]|uniref:PARP catalytic domain-containing protein n=1 Tax=Neospora caninum (strain Liverpool) TaxID=572307 RepID=F0VFK0_NEOCL|nr:conserved hypothetical protein [Neospora caninum Liverpool]CBZ52494.1 conserved hypothetical protein [Neospora caninum Liverpool]CEL66471.1 TPA: hypothetical protein BN1204_022830 [Neospora caninum Liverpool]|eukprot:XP_003882526.1 conserved hypothetical protein [Neospora caninum Liverpool]